MSHASGPDVTAVVLAYREEPWLRACLESLIASTDVRVDVVLVDNGCSNPELEELGRRKGVRVLRPGSNLGYAGGCNAGAAAGEGQVLVFVNSDCTVRSDALSVLATAARTSAGLVTASVRLGEDPDRLNSEGNPVHFLGFSWAGGLGQLPRTPDPGRDVASVSGACFAVTRDVWKELGGFPEIYFAYHEDVELSLRCWLSGRPVRYVPGAVAMHHYRFSRHPQKMYLLERNRLATWLTLLQRRTLVLLLPAMIASELAVAAVAAQQGWLRQKARGWVWVLRRLPWIVERRRTVQQQRRRSDKELAVRLTSTLNPGGAAMPAMAHLANLPLRLYWGVVRRCL